MIRRTLMAVALAAGSVGALVGISAVGTPLAVAATTTQPGHPERHPEIRKAIFHLEQAKHELENGAHDFDGHRAAALKATEDALAQCREALQADKP